MTKALVIGDPHFKVDNLHEVELFIKKIKQTAQETQPDFIVCLGDLLHTHERIHTTPLNKAYEFIDELRGIAKVFLLVGNHDYIQNQQFLTENHWMNGMKDWYNVTIVDKVTVLNKDDCKFVFSPYVPPGRFLEALDTIDRDEWSDATCIFAHQELYGCKLGREASVEGDRWLEEYPQVVSGHIHIKHKLGTNIYYTGSPMQHAFDEPDTNTVALLTFSPGIVYDLEEIDLRLPKKVVVNVSIDNVNDITVDKTIDQKVKVTIEGNYDEFKSFKKTEKFKELTDSGTKVVFKLTKKEQIEDQLKPDLTETGGGFKKILETLVVNERNPFLSEVYEFVVNNREVHHNDILFL